MIGACLAFRNAAPYLREWLLFHLAAGVERFYLYDNDSEDDFANVLAPFLAHEIDGIPLVTLRSWPGYFQQNAIYNDCLARARGEVEWLAFIDDDEFLLAADGRPLGVALSPFEDHAGVAVCWHLFGSSQRVYWEREWVVRRFLRRAALPDQHVKCIVRPDRVDEAVAGGHLFRSRPGWSLVDEQRRPVSSPLTAHPSADVLRINHYLVKSIEELIVRRTARDIGTGDRPKLPLVEWLRLDQQWNACEDRVALGFVERMEEIDRCLAFPQLALAGACSGDPRTKVGRF